MQKLPVYSFCFGDQCESLSSKMFAETLKVFLLAEIAKMFKEIVELFWFLHINIFVKSTSYHESHAKRSIGGLNKQIHRRIR